MKKENLDFISENESIDSSIFDVEMEIPDPSSMYECDKKKKPKDKMSINEVAEIFLKNPNNKTFGDLWERSWWGLREQIHKIVPDNDMVEDIAISTLQKVWEKKDTFNPEVAKFSTWMYRICINEALGYKLRKKRENLVDNDVSDLYAKTLFKGESETFDDDSYKYSDKFEKTPTGDIRLIGYEDIITNMVDASVNILQDMKDPRVKICMIEKNRSVFWPVIKNNPKYQYLENLIKKDTEWNKNENSNMKLEDISVKYDYPLTSVKNWIHKGKIDLGKIMKQKYPDLYDMWKEVA